MNPVAIRDTLRDGSSRSLRRRRAIGALGAVGLVDFALISLYQMGVLRNLVDPPGRVFDSNKVNASEKAYALGLPDGTTGTALYAAILMLASAGGTRRTGRPRVADVALAGVVTTGVVGAADYLWNMIFRQKKVCPYCLVGAAVNFAMAPLALKEAWAALRGT